MTRQDITPAFTIADPTGEPSDEAIEALARLLLSMTAEPTTSTTTTDVATKKSPVAGRPKPGK